LDAYTETVPILHVDRGCLEGDAGEIKVLTNADGWVILICRWRA
jgi:hypothetical protein